ncbi:MAG: hypothetical protein AAFY42_14805 [Pseudomonadota bacterium]
MTKPTLLAALLAGTALGTSAVAQDVSQTLADEYIAAGYSSVEITVGTGQIERRRWCPVRCQPGARR